MLSEKSLLKDNVLPEIKSATNKNTNRPAIIAKYITLITRRNAFEFKLLVSICEFKFIIKCLFLSRQL